MKQYCGVIVLRMAIVDIRVGNSIIGFSIKLIVFVIERTEDLFVREKD